jgi:hypothetical protein
MQKPVSSTGFAYLFIFRADTKAFSSGGGDLAPVMEKYVSLAFLSHKGKHSHLHAGHFLFGQWTALVGGKLPEYAFCLQSPQRLRVPDP